MLLSAKSNTLRFVKPESGVRFEISLFCPTSKVSNKPASSSPLKEVMPLREAVSRVSLAIASGRIGSRSPLSAVPVLTAAA